VHFVSFCLYLIVSVEKNNYAYQRLFCFLVSKFETYIENRTGLKWMPRA